MRMPMKPTFRYDDVAHEYFITTNGTERLVPSVTQVLEETIGQSFHATEWHMHRGSMVHLCMSWVLEGKQFTCDPRIEGRIEGGRNFLSDMNGEVLAVEHQMFSERYRYGGTCDLVMKIPKYARLLVDWKGTLSDTAEIQMGGYSLLYPRPIEYGVAVELHDDATYKMSPIYKLRGPRQEFKGLLTTYNVKARLGRLTKQEE